MKKLILLLFIPLVSFGQDDIDYSSERSVIEYFDTNPSKDVLEGVWWTSGGRVVIRKNLDNYVAIFSDGDGFYHYNNVLNYGMVAGDTVATLELSNQGNKLYVKYYNYLGCKSKKFKRCLDKDGWYFNDMERDLSKWKFFRQNGTSSSRPYNIYRAVSDEYVIDFPSIVKISEANYSMYSIINYSLTSKKQSDIAYEQFAESEYISMNITDRNYYWAPFFKMYPKSNLSNKKPNPKTGEWAGNGSGFIISKSGYIVTNNHVIEDAAEIEVEFILNDEVQKFNAEIVQVDKVNDLAIIKIVDMNFDGVDELPYNFKTRSSDVGTKVYAYGYPMALSIMGKEIKITDGIISSKSGYDGDITTYQISAPIQGGNSGGPLFDDKGNLIGINSSGLTKDIADNVGYTIKSSYVLNLIDVLPKNIDLPSNTKLQSLPLTEQIKEITKYVVLIKVK